MKSDKEDKKSEKVVKPTIKFPKKEYIVRNRVLIGDKWYEKGNKISLTEVGYKYLRSINKV